jgi:membrane glycosyltransferase
MAETASVSTAPLQGWMPPRAPCPMPVRGLKNADMVRSGPPTARATVIARRLLVAITLGLAAILIWLMGRALLAGPNAPGMVEIGVLILFSLSVLWTASAAAVALIGATRPLTAPPALPRGWTPTGRAAILILLCGEPPVPVARQIDALKRDLARTGLTAAIDIFVLSDTRDPARVAAESLALAPLAGQAGIYYRRRATNAGRKPGNIADWVGGWGGAYRHMLVLDADSRMSGARIRAMIYRMEHAPDTALIQAGMRLLPAQSRFGALQRLSGRLCGPGFGRGFAAWTGAEGNFWGHNALLRIDAFAAAAGLPRLTGRPPFGGDILSHDFVEAAWLRRAGWAVVLDPDSRGSFEDGPQTMGAFHRRDRRWCQGNLQHLRLLAARGLHPVSRLHLLSGILSYLAAPLWLGLVLAIALGRPGLDTVLPLVGGLGLLLVPKLAGGWIWLRRCRSAARRRVVLRALAAETLLSTLIAPILLIRQSAAVAAVLAGRDCGWRPDAGAVRPRLPAGAFEALAGLALIGLATPFAQTPGQLALLLPVLGPLLAAPLLTRWLERPSGAHAGAPATPSRRPAAEARVALPPVPSRAA